VLSFRKRCKAGRINRQRYGYLHSLILKRLKEIEKQLVFYAIMLNDKFGVTLAPFYITRKEFKTRVRKSKSPVDSIIKEGKVISGLSIKSMING